MKNKFRMVLFVILFSLSLLFVNEVSATEISENSQIESTISETEKIQITKPNKVTGIKTEKRYTNKLELAWDKVSVATGYRIYIYNSNTEKYEYYGATKTNSITIENLKQCTTYKIKVRAYKIVDGEKIYGKYSEVHSTLTIPNQVKNIEITSISANTIDLKWDKISRVTGYRIYIYNAETDKYEYYGKTKKNTITINSLKTNKKYKIKIRAYKSFDGVNYFGKYSSILDATTIPKKVTGVKTEKRYTNKLELAWDKVSVATGYRVYIYNSNTEKYEYYGATKTNSITIKNLKQCTIYKIKIRAYKTVDGKKYYGKYSSIHTTITLPNKLTNLEFSSVSYDSLGLKWNKISRVTGYRIYIYNEETEKYEYYGKTKKNSITIDSLNPKKEYKIRIRAYKNVDGVNYFGKYSDVITAGVKPTKVKNISLEKIASDGILLSWNKVSKTTGYRVYIDKGCTGEYTYYGATKTNSMKITSLAEGTKYKIKVRAYKTFYGTKYFGKNSEEIQFTTGIEKLTISKTKYKNAERLVYGTSGNGRDLVYYRLGKEDADNVMILNFAIHGYEDSFSQDGYELVLVAHKLIKYLSNNIKIVNENNWCIYVIPTSNPDGVTYRNGPKTGACSGIGRKTYYILNEDGTLTKGGIDLNRCFPYNHAGGFKRYYGERDYNGTEPMMAKEAVALNKFILDSNKKKVSGKKIFIDVHGWTNQIITAEGSKLYNYLNEEFNYNYHTDLDTKRAYGYVSYWALKNGYDSCLFEFPFDVGKRGDVAKKGYDTKFINAIKNIINKY